jgi:triosephosphate isomerase
MLIAGNWKMYKGPAETAEFCLGLREQELDGVDVVVCPPFVSLAVAVQLLAGTEIAVAAQNVHWEDEGAYTGCTGRLSGTPSAGSTSGRPTKRWRRGFTPHSRQGCS